MANRALLVGINSYPSSPLAGCVNDVLDMANFLVNKCNFKSDEIRLLTDGRATTSAIFERLEWLVNANPGDRVVFHYSGHGVQVPVRNGDTSEIDGLSECIAPVEFNWSPEHMITDKQFISIFSRMSNDVRFAWISDSCHSGDLDRELPSRTDRQIRIKRFPVPADIGWRQRIAKEKNLQADRGLINNVLNVGFIAGCRSDQTSADSNFEKPNGALTYYLLKHLDLTTPLSTVIQNVRNDLAKNGFSQIPQVEGTRIHMPFLGDSQIINWLK